MNTDLSKHPLIVRLGKLFETLEHYTDEQEINLCIAETVHDHQEDNDLNEGWFWTLSYMHPACAWKPKTPVEMKRIECKDCNGRGNHSILRGSDIYDFQHCEACNGIGHTFKAPNEIK